jgi:hypothetical protein
MAIAKKSDRPLDMGAQMLTAKFRNAEFPVVSWSFGFDHAQAQHLYVDRDAGIIEATGRNPARYQFNAVFRAGLMDRTLIYPDLWRLFVAACSDRSTATLVHPELGEVSAKCVRCHTSYDPNRRDGVDVDLEFVEASSTEDELDSVLKAKSPTSSLGAALDLDSALGSIPNMPELPEELGPSALESIRKLSGAIASVKAGVGNIAGTIDSYLSALTQLQEEIASLDDPSSWPAIEACERLFVSLLEVADDATRKSKPVAPVVVAATASPSAVADFFRMKLDDFLALNPRVASRTEVEAGTEVFVHVTLRHRPRLDKRRQPEDGRGVSRDRADIAHERVPHAMRQLHVQHGGRGIWRRYRQKVCAWVKVAVPRQRHAADDGLRRQHRALVRPRGHVHLGAGTRCVVDAGG